jgi:hypothetical protein
MSSIGSRKDIRAPFTFGMDNVRKKGRMRKNRGGCKFIHAVNCATHSRRLRHVVLLHWHRSRRPPHLRGIFCPAVGCVERRARHPKGNQARTRCSDHQSGAHAARYRHPPASLARTAASRTSAAALESRSPDRDLPRCRPRVQTRLRTGHQCSAQNGVA